MTETNLIQAMLFSTRSIAATLLASAALACSCGGSTPAATTASNAPAGADNAPNTTPSQPDAKLGAAIAGSQRTDKERARDGFRHPLETLQFLGVRDNMNAVELSAGGGWYTAILAPYLAEKGKLAVTAADPNGPPDSEGTKGAKALAERFAKDPASFGKVTTVVADWSKDVSLGPDGSVDMVVTFRNMHGWIRDGAMQRVLAACFRVLKSGGTLGIEEHRARPEGSTDAKTIGDTGYVPEAHAIKLVEQAGFKLVAKAEINANPKDTKDHPKGVWTLPPTLRLGDVDREKYAAIGESDRMTLKFVKP